MDRHQKEHRNTAIHSSRRSPPKPTTNTKVDRKHIVATTTETTDDNQIRTTFPTRNKI
jgi:hypothetical protein